MDNKNFEAKFVSLALDVAKAVAAFQKHSREQCELKLSESAANRETPQELKPLSPIHFGGDSI